MVVTAGRDYPLHPPRAGRHQAGDPCPVGCVTVTHGGTAVAVLITALSGIPADRAEYTELWCPRCTTSLGRE